METTVHFHSLVQSKLTQLVVNGLKLTTGVLLPDTNYFSFPGYTAAAAYGSTLLYKEYGFKGYWD